MKILLKFSQTLVSWITLHNHQTCSEFITIWIPQSTLRLENNEEDSCGGPRNARDQNHQGNCFNFELQ